jgi:hypothetical protein
MLLLIRTTVVMLVLSMLHTTPRDNAAVGQTIDWVDFSSYPTGSLSAGPFQSTGGELVLDVEFANTVNMRSGNPGSGTAVIDDPSWPFDNDDVSLVSAISAPGTTLTSDLRFDFTNFGGLPEGGSIGIIDLELAGSSVTLRGFAGGNQVSVNWELAFYQVQGANVPPPIWDPVTATLTGAGEGFPTTNNFAFLVSDVQLDSVELGITGENGDGIGFAASADTVPIPEPSSGCLLIAAAFGCGLRRRP